MRPRIKIPRPHAEAMMWGYKFSAMLTKNPRVISYYMIVYVNDGGVRMVYQDYLEPRISMRYAMNVITGEKLVVVSRSRNERTFVKCYRTPVHDYCLLRFYPPSMYDVYIELFYVVRSYGEAPD